MCSSVQRQAAGASASPRVPFLLWSPPVPFPTSPAFLIPGTSASSSTLLRSCAAGSWCSMTQPSPPHDTNELESVTKYHLLKGLHSYQSLIQETTSTHVLKFFSDALLPH